MLKKITSHAIHDKWFPVLLAGIGLASFGLLINQLGFYWDDWLELYMVHTRDQVSEIFLSAYRPLLVWKDLALYPLLGANPRSWQILSLALRWLAAVLVWRLLKEIWPQHKEFAAWASILFLIYPSFFQQPVAIAYHNHWAAYVLYLLSLWTMVLAVKGEKGQWAWLGISVVSGIAHLLIVEYLVGLEMLRPIFLWIVLSQEPLRNRFKKMMLRWSPHLVTLAGFVIWRLFFVVIEKDPNPPKLLIEIRNTPIQGLLHLLENSLQDILALLVENWSDLLSPSLIDFSDRGGLISWGIGLAGIVILYFIWQRFDFQEKETRQTTVRYALLIGISGLLLGFAPSWVTGRLASVGFYSSRLSIPAMFSASLLIVTLVFQFVQHKSSRTWLLCILVGLSISAHLRHTNEYRWDWQRQQDFFRQMQWRAPQVETGTAFVADGAATVYLTDYNAALALNLLYAPDSKTDEMPYWWLTFDQISLEELLETDNVQHDFYAQTYQGTSNNLLAINTSPGLGSCLWILSEKDVLNKDIPVPMRELLALTNPEVIQAGPAPAGAPLFEDMIGKAPSLTWCEVFQKADLARQSQNWHAVFAMEALANERSWIPGQGHGYEYHPFIEAYLATENWAKAAELTVAANKKAPNTRALYCALWDAYDSNAEAYAEAFIDINDRLGCE